jgi:hypothetical protein
VTGPPQRPDDDPMGPPPGQDGAPEPPSEFLTPVHPYETVEPDPGASWPASPMGTPPPGPPARRRRSGVGAAVVAVVLVAAGLVWIVSDRSSTAPLDPPSDLIATAGVCAAPECERIEGIVTLSWSSSGDADAYEILRSQGVVQTLPGDATTYEVRGLRIERSYQFGVRAVVDGERGEAGRVRVRTPAPPLEEAQLTGGYRVRERVRSATNLSSVEGIRHPRPGSSTTNIWTFEAVCDAQAGACPTAWFSWGPLRNDGTRYGGTFRTRPATCGGGGRVPTTTEMHLVATSARTVDDHWIVDRFRGSMHVSFSCPGGGRSAGMLQIQGRMADGS